MKKFFAIASLALAAVSCLDTNTFYYNQNVHVAFDELLYDVNGKCVFESDDQEYLASSFYDGGLNFYCRLDKDKNYLGGFSIARLCDTTVFTHPASEAFPHCVAYGLPVSKDTLYRANVYAVYRDEADTSKMPKVSTFFAFADAGTLAPISVKVNNTLEMVASSYGAAGSEPFVKGDWVKVRFTGYKEGAVTGTVDCSLFDWTDADKREVLKEWKTVELKELGLIDRMDVNVVSNRSGFPCFVCLDDLWMTLTLGSKEDSK